MTRVSRSCGISENVASLAQVKCMIARNFANAGSRAAINFGRMAAKAGERLAGERPG